MIWKHIGPGQYRAKVEDRIYLIEANGPDRWFLYWENNNMRRSIRSMKEAKGYAIKIEEGREG